MSFYDAFDDKPVRPAGQIITLPAPAGGTPYGQTALTDEANKVAAAPEGTRNHQLNLSAFKLCQLITGGQLEPADVHDTLTVAARQAGLDDREIEATLLSAWRAGTQNPRQPEPQGLLVNGHAAPVVVPQRTQLEIVRDQVDQITGEVSEQHVDFWDARPVLNHIRQFALARMASPWAVLGVVMLRTLATIPPHVVLPSLIGGYGSLNLFCALVAKSGHGKGAASNAGRDAIRQPTSVYTATVGSGEGIAHQYAHREKGHLVWDRHSVLFNVNEVDTLTALGSRQGSTLLSQLRSAFSGETLGFGYADAMKRIPIEEHSYRLLMTVGVQPEKAGPLLDDADGGTPQRFVWLPATDRIITADIPDEPKALILPPINWNQLPTRAYGHSIIDVPMSVSRFIREQHAARARGEGDALDGHSLFAREKVAAAVAVLDQRGYIDEEDWQLAGVVMARSDITRAGVQETLTAALDRSEKARSKSAAARAVDAAEAVEEAAMQRVCRSVMRHVAAGEIEWASLRRKLASRDRDSFDEAVARLVEAGQISVVEEPDLRSPEGVARTVKSVTA